jgi:release factor glutamine methyltransferase
MTLRELQHNFHAQLDAIYGKNEVHGFFKLLVEHHLNFKPIEIVLQPNYNVSNAEQDYFNEAINRLRQEEPIQYILGVTEFFGMPFKVNPYTLIPRPETEELVQWIIDEESNSNPDSRRGQIPIPIAPDSYRDGTKFQIPNLSADWHDSNNKHLTILDIGAGSGCIAVSLAKHLPNTKVYALDISPEALDVARENAELNGVEVECIEADILTSCHAELPPDVRAGVSASHKFDIIVSNPPYVRELEKSTIKNNVLKHEPHLALFVEDDDPLLFYKAICEFAVHNLKPKGRLFFEINQYLGAEMKQLLSTFDFESVELRQDVFGNDRIIKSIKP